MKFLLLLLSLISTVSFGQTLEDLPKKVKSNVRIKYDDMYEITKITSKFRTRYKATYWNKLTLVKNNDSYYLVLLTKRDVDIKYGNWLFFERMIIKTDKNVYNFDYDKLETRVGDYNLEERAYKIFYPLSNGEDKEFLDDFLSSKKVKIRYEGKSSYKDIKGNERNLRAMRPVYRTLQHLMGELPDKFKK